MLKYNGFVKAFQPHPNVNSAVSEISQVLNLVDQKAEGSYVVIPLRLEKCPTPERLSELQGIDLFAPKGYDKLLRALQTYWERLQQAKAEAVAKAEAERQAKEKAEAQLIPQPLPRRHPFEPEMILIPAGEFIMGSDPHKDELARDDELPQHILYLPNYYLAKTPITNAQYEVFVQDTGHQSPKSWKSRQPHYDQKDHPVYSISWYDALAFCRWLSLTTGRLYNLPSEAEWEKGARWTDGRIYPWGDEWYAQKCNCNTEKTSFTDLLGFLLDRPGKTKTTPVNAYPQGASPYGLLDMSGNVWEWTRSLWGTDRDKPDFCYP